MEYRILGSTGISVSLLSLGTLPLGPLQANLPLTEGAGIIRNAIQNGINLIDTAELYQTYPYIKMALEGIGEEAMVASKSYAITAGEMQCAIEKAVEETGRRIIDLFMLHQQESELTLKGHAGALRFMAEAKKKGLIRAAGLSTHHIAAVKAATAMEEVDFIFAPLNRQGLAIQDGTLQEMSDALEEASRAGKGILAMKPLGGGHLWREAEESFAFLKSVPFITSINAGVQSLDELEMDVSLMEGIPVPDVLRQRIGRKTRRLHIEDCQGCGRCVERCPFGALSHGSSGTTVDCERCVLCGYCASVCPEFCIKVM